MERLFNKPNEKSMGFVIKITKNGYMDVKNIYLYAKGVKLFPAEMVMYMFILNMSKTNRLEISKDFQEFIKKELGFSRAYFYKIIKALVQAEVLSRTTKRGWYKMNGLSMRLRKDF